MLFFPQKLMKIILIKGKIMTIEKNRMSTEPFDHFVFISIKNSGKKTQQSYKVTKIISTI